MLVIMINASLLTHTHMYTTESKGGMRLAGFMVTTSEVR